MPRRKKIKPVPHAGKYEKFIKVKYEQMGKRKTFEMDIPATNEVGLNSMLEPLIARKLGVESADIWIVDEPYMVTNIKEDASEVQE